MVFDERLFNFLVQLAANNNREWFNAHKDEYEPVLREPALECVRQIAGPLAELSPLICAPPTVSRAEERRCTSTAIFASRPTSRRTSSTSASNSATNRVRRACCAGRVFHWGRQLDARPQRATSLSPRHLRASRRVVRRQAARGVGRLEHRWALRRAQTPATRILGDDPMIEDIKRKHFIVTHRMDMEDVIAPDFVETRSSASENPGTGWCSWPKR